MASLKFSATSELNFYRPDRSLVCESTSLYGTEAICYNYKLWLSHDKRKTRSGKIMRDYGCNVERILEKPSKDFLLQKPFTSFANCVQIAFGHNTYPFSRLKRIRITGLQGATVHESSEESSKRKTVILKSPNSNVVKNENAGLRNNMPRTSRRKLWKRFPGVKEAIQGQALRPNSGSKEQSLVQERNGSSSVSNVNDDGNELEAALSAIGPTSSVEHCNSILKRLERSSDEKTLNFFEWMRSNAKLKGNATAYNSVLRVLGRKEDWNAAEMLLQEMTANIDCELNSQVFNTLIYACYKRGLAEWGTKWFHSMLENGVQPNVATYGMLMNLYQKGGKLSDAEFAFTHMRSCKLHCNAAYSAMITMYTRLGLYEKSEEIISILKEDEVQPNLENWLVQLNAYSQQGKLEEAESVLKLMQAAGISPNIIAYNTLITGYGKVANMDATQRLFQNLENIGLEPDETTYRSLVEGFGRADNYKEAMWYYKELKRSGFYPNSSNFYTMINLQAKHKDEEGAIQTLKDMRVMGCQYSSILSSLLQAYERVGKMDKVLFILKASFYQNILLDQTSCSILAMACVQHGLLDDALQVLHDKQWTDPIYEDNLYHLMICSCKEAGRHENAIKIFTQMPKSSTNPNLHITCTMIDIYSSMDQFNDAENLYLKLKSSGIVLDMIAYSIVVRMYIKGRSLKDACSVLDAMEKQKNIVPDTFLFRDMLRIYQQCGMLEKLSDVYYQILKSGSTWDEEMYNCVINCCGHALPVDEVSRLFNEMIRRGFSANTITFNVMLDVYGKARLFKKLRKVLWMAKRQGLVDAITFNTVIAAYGQNKDYKNMKSTFRHMRFSGFPVSLEAYNSMLDAYGKGDRFKAFNGVLQKMKEASCVSDHYTYNIMINIYARKGWIEEVAGVLAELRERGLEPDLWSYNTLIKAYGIAGMVEEAVNIVKEMRAKGIEPDQVTYINLITALQKNNNFLEAVKWSLWMKQLGMSSSKC
ncbi:pentatricopeptide repeat-containing protein At4g30825, chloroplastic [Magnolia sinica]|uniref:pentatricopeptide repeat-containing protein At4g30825, chloroplastic n=1 Tax=Magnolia sinica TaxID=86752 RepID=UPI00265999BC|nr:pentatricopeptide repeat-containing protein At4g30825, chloroplastic [Magnolia sinica]XP_058067737.1 pentatricopeptide repeat-containing protein At4g30825, chloroplastic [Magnolia sinica]XP_058067738.1 pentatricopeptide repeat-containing protein At4g30825, chloroplastic [Magnolia sinica]XP_058067739.1 pentatricopeptide repeat-containing protein At4g30825, chloroplastic [Magnolia sinica]